MVTLNKESIYLVQKVPSMPVTVNWDDPEKTIILITITTPMTWELYDEGIDEARQLALSVPYRVDVISNPGSSEMPPGPSLPHLRRAYANFPDNISVIVAVITNVFSRIMSLMTGQLYLGPRFRVVESVEAARTMIHKSRVAAETK